MSCIVYTMSCNSISYAICLLALMVYKYNELQVFSGIQKLSCKASCKTPFFFIMKCKCLISIYICVNVKHETCKCKIM